MNLALGCVNEYVQWKVEGRNEYVLRLFLLLSPSRCGSLTRRVSFGRFLLVGVIKVKMTTWLTIAALGPCWRGHLSHNDHWVDCSAIALDSCLRGHLSDNEFNDHCYCSRVAALENLSQNDHWVNSSIIGGGTHSC